MRPRQQLTGLYMIKCDVPAFILAVMFSIDENDYCPSHSREILSSSFVGACRASSETRLRNLAPSSAPGS